VDLVLGNLEKTRLLEYVNEREPRGVFVSRLDDHGTFTEMEVSDFSRHTRAFLKIQDGCDAGCAYCVVPDARGRSRSRRFDSLVAHVSGFIRAGYRELVLTGINLGRYRDPRRPERDLLYLLEWLEERVELGRVRLSSIEPTDFSEEIINFLSRSRKICRHLHIPLQSGDDEILRAMGRPYRANEYAHLVTVLADRIPGIAIGADVIVGFPGETRAQFQATHRLIEKLPICRLHVFNYSRREGTRAANAPCQVPPEVRRDRSQMLRILSRAKFSAFRRSFLNHQLMVLIEQRRDPHTGLLTGLSDNYIRVLVEGSDRLMNRLVPLQIYRVDEHRAWGRPIDTAWQ
jgi:threonylcarbamoyladenosine tRNA methylthiotransferase MtaB